MAGMQQTLEIIDGDVDWLMRIAAFNFLQQLTERVGTALPWAMLHRGFADLCRRV
jgi:hypothetical protein